MVHALKRLHQFLKPDGRLIDIHPLETPRPIKVRIADEVYLAGWLRETDDYIEYVQASEALARAVELGLFAVERQETFIYSYHAQSIEALRDHLLETSHDAIIDELVVMRADDLMRVTEPDTEVLMEVPVRITRFRPLFEK